VGESATPLIADANVLIDYVNCDVSILALLAQHAGPLYVSTPVLEKVEGLDSSECERLGLVVIEPTLEQLLEAGQARGRLAFDDRVCLILARDRAWRCVTNDKALRRACADEGITVCWGLEIMLSLVEQAVLAVEDALGVAASIQVANSAFIAEAILHEFEHKAHEAARRAVRRGGK